VESAQEKEKMIVVIMGASLLGIGLVNRQQNKPNWKIMTVGGSIITLAGIISMMFHLGL